MATVKEKRLAMAKKFEITQVGMSQVVDDIGIARRSAVPFASTWQGQSISTTGPVPTDNHLIPSNMVIFKSEPPSFKGDRSSTHANLNLSGKPWACYEKSTPAVFVPPDTVEPPPRQQPRKMDEEMFRTQYQEWVLQKNAFNPDIAAAMRTNVRKMASLSVVDPATSQDPARSSENVRAALLNSDVTGAAAPEPRKKITPGNTLPMMYKAR